MESNLHSQLSPSPAWLPNTAILPDVIPLVERNSAWMSARENLPLVQSLVAEEVAAGFVSLVPQIVEELKSRYARVAVGKLGLVIAESGSPRLVADSSVSNVTNTVLPIRMLLPRISDLLRCAPSSTAREQIIQLTLDVSKSAPAHLGISR
jgi:hypothetical protein